MILQINIAPKEIKDERKNDDRSQDLQEPEKDSPDPHKFLTPEELESGKLPPEEILSLPMFKVWTLNVAKYLHILLPCLILLGVEVLHSKYSICLLG